MSQKRSETNSIGVRRLEHPNSIWGTATPEIRAKIKAARKQHDSDRQAVENWFQAGCGPSHFAWEIR